MSLSQRLRVLVPGLLLVSAVALPAACTSPGAMDRAPSTGEELAAETSVKPGINESWKSEDIGPLVERLEPESREIYAQRGLIAAVTGPKPGAVVADIGAGSGFMAHLFSRMVGPAGKVYAVDINPSLLEHIASGARERGLSNLQTVLCTEKSVELAPASVDLVFVCDTYHHFEYPKNTLSTIHRALRPGGQLVVVDFERIEGVSSDWVLGHVRAGKDVFSEEIVAAGFELTNEHDLEALADNYILRFRRK
jgi:SAM-dependent methyltransferase